MTVEWNLEPVARAAATGVARASLPILRATVSGRFPLVLERASIWAPYEGLVAEYGDGSNPPDPWVFRGLAAVRERFGGDL